MPDPFAPQKSGRFTFGLWTVGNIGRDPFGEPVRNPIPPTRIVERLSELGAYRVNLHDNDLVPIHATAAERDGIVREFKKALADHDMKVPMATTNTFSHPVFRDGGFTSNDPKVRAYGLQKIISAIDLENRARGEDLCVLGRTRGCGIKRHERPRDRREKIS